MGRRGPVAFSADRPARVAPFLNHPHPVVISYPPRVVCARRQTMGVSFSKFWARLFANKEMRILVHRQRLDWPGVVCVWGSGGCAL